RLRGDFDGRAETAVAALEAEQWRAVAVGVFLDLGHQEQPAAVQVLADDAAPVDRRAPGDRRRDGALRWVEHRDLLLGELVARARSRRPDGELRLAVAEQRDAQLPALTGELRSPPARRARHRQQRRLVGVGA